MTRPTFDEFELKPSTGGMLTWLWHAARLHVIDFNNWEPRGGQFRCLTCGEKWWW